MPSYPALNYANPGVRAANETFEANVFWGDPLIFNSYKFHANIDGASRDNSHTGQTTVLRAGLLMGYHVANKYWLPYDSGLTANEGDTIQGILYETINMQLDGADVDRFSGIIAAPGAPILWNNLWTNDTGAAGSAGDVPTHANAAAIRAALIAAPLNYRLDDWYQQ